MTPRKRIINPIIIIIKDNFINNIRYKDQNTLLIFFPLILSISILFSTHDESLVIVFLTIV